MRRSLSPRVQAMPHDNYESTDGRGIDEQDRRVSISVLGRSEEVRVGDACMKEDLTGRSQQA